MVAALVFRR